MVFAWCLLSAVWAPGPVFVVTQTIAIVTVAIIALAFSFSGWHPDRFENTLTGVTTFMLAWSLLYALMFPKLGIHQSDALELANAWHGIIYQKNGLGQLAAVGLIVWTHLWSTRRVTARSAVLGLGLSLFMLLKSRSSTSLMLALLCCLGVLLITRPTVSIGRLGRRAVLLTLAVLIPVGLYLSVATNAFAPVGNMVGKDGTFTGRKPIWDAMISEIHRHPWLGTGLTSFWEVDPGVLRVREAVQWPVRTAHNGYLEVANELGMIGLGLLIVFFICHCFAIARLAKVNRDAYALHLPLFVYLIMANVSENGWLFPNSPSHVIGTYCSIEISRQLLAHSMHQRRMKAQAIQSRNEAAVRAAA